MQIFDPGTRKSFLAKVQELAISLQGFIRVTRHSQLRCHVVNFLPTSLFRRKVTVVASDTGAVRDFSGFISRSPLQNLAIASFWRTRRGWETLDYYPLLIEGLSSS